MKPSMVVQPEIPLAPHMNRFPLRNRDGTMEEDCLLIWTIFIINAEKYYNRDLIGFAWFNMFYSIASALTVLAISTLAWYSYVWKRDFSTRYSKLDPECISNSMLKYRRK